MNQETRTELYRTRHNRVVPIETTSKSTISADGMHAFVVEFTKMPWDLMGDKRQVRRKLRERGRAVRGVKRYSGRKQ